MRAAAVLGAASLALAACGTESTGDEGASADAASTSSAATTEPAEVAAADCVFQSATAGATPVTTPLKLGSILPATGTLAYLGPPMRAGIDVAVEEINAAGGVLGQAVELTSGDEGDAATDTASSAFDRQLAEGVSAIVGAASSSASMKIIDKAVAAGVTMVSPSNTSDEFGCYQDNGQYFRTAPTDSLQSQAVAQLMAAEAVQRAVIIARNDPYGMGLADSLAENLIASGVPADQIKQIAYDPAAQSFNAEVDQIKDFAPDGVAVVSYEEGAKLISRMHEVGIGPSDGMLVFGVDGNMGNALGEQVAPGVLEGMTGSAGETDTGEEFQARLKAKDPSLTDLQYSGEAYDAAILIALAASQAKSTAGVDIAANMISVTKDGEKCDSYASCLALLETGADIDYDGRTGGIEFDEGGNPQAGSYAHRTFGADNTFTTGGYIIIGG
jgi:branched-chain amino acid transport system substrate-binding protein